LFKRVKENRPPKPVVVNHGHKKSPRKKCEKKMGQKKRRRDHTSDRTTNPSVIQKKKKKGQAEEGILKRKEKKGTGGDNPIGHRNFAHLLELKPRPEGHQEGSSEKKKEKTRRRGAVTGFFLEILSFKLIQLRWRVPGHRINRQKKKKKEGKGHGETNKKVGYRTKKEEVNGKQNTITREGAKSWQKNAPGRELPPGPNSRSFLKKKAGGGGDRQKGLGPLKSRH